MLRLPPQRLEWYRDRDGVWTRQKRSDDILTDEILFTDLLNSGETIASFTWIDNSGPTISGDAINGDANGITFTVTDSGDVTLRVVTSAARVIEMPLRWFGLDTYPISDYGA